MANQVKLAKFVIYEQVKIVCFQETHLQDMEMKYLREVFRDTIYHAAASSRSKRVVIGEFQRIYL